MHVAVLHPFLKALQVGNQTKTFARNRNMYRLSIGCPVTERENSIFSNAYMYLQRTPETVEQSHTNRVNLDTSSQFKTASRQ